MSDDGSWISGGGGHARHRVARSTAPKEDKLGRNSSGGTRRSRITTRRRTCRGGGRLEKSLASGRQRNDRWFKTMSAW
jgi:hypothetical protein